MGTDTTMGIMRGVHIYTAREQPATRYFDTNIERWRKMPKRRLLYCFKCRKRHRAENMVVQVYYDMIPAFCRRGFAGGCRK